jgi:hypothetical protein
MPRLTRPVRHGPLAPSLLLVAGALACADPTSPRAPSEGRAATAADVAACHDPPDADEITVWQHSHFSGNCRTLGIGRYPNSSYLSPVGNDAISSLKVGSDVRAHLYEHAQFEGHVALYEAGSAHDVAESGDLGLGPNVNDETTSIVVQANSGLRVPYIFIGDFPSDVENSFSEEIQGMCHDESSWFITRNHPPTLLKIPLSSDLRRARAVAAAPIPQSLREIGYNHMGDPDCKNGFVFVPLEATGHFATTQAAVAVFDSQVQFVNWGVLYVNDDNHAGWVAIDPAGSGSDLWTSRTDMSRGDNRGRFYRYTIDWSQVVPGGGSIFLDGAGKVGRYRNRFGAPLAIKGMQGGAFDIRGDILFVTNSDRESPDGHGVWALDKRTGELLGETSNGYGQFRYTTHGPDEEEEEEGLDYFPTNESITPGIAGQLHAILLNNDVFTADNFWMKHYKLFQRDR